MFRLIPVLCLSLTLGLGSVLAQSGLGSITGIVQDSTGGVISGATVRLTESATQVSRTTSANESGLFTFPAVTVGTYTVAISHPGFKEKKIENLGINAFQQVALGQISLEVGAAAETVTVTASAEQAALVRDSAVRYETIQSRQVTNMPLAGRNWVTLLKVIPGAIPTNATALNGREYTSTGYADYRINGKGGGQTQVNLDGGSIVDQGSDAKTSVAPSLESIQEVSVLTNNFQAEYGTRGGTVINIVTKSGTNDFHGTVFDYLRNEALNANSWANNYIGTKRPRYRFNYFGANVGGPIKNNKLFFFYNYEKFLQDTPSNIAFSRTPTDLERNGDFSQTLNPNGQRPVMFLPGTQLSGTPVPIPNNILPASLINPLGRAIINMFPKPNLADNLTNNYQLQFQQKQPRFASVAKGDWNINDNTRSYIRYTWDGGTQEDRSNGGNWGNLPGITKRPRPDRALAANITRTFSNTLVMEALYSWNFDQVEWLPGDPDSLLKSKYGLSALPTVFKPSNDYLPEITGTGFANFNFNRIPAIAINNEHQFSTSFTWTKGSHIIKFGGQHIRNYKDEIDTATDGGDKGRYDFGVNSNSPFDTAYGPTNLLTGALSSFQQVQNVKRKNAIYTDVHMFVQDTWKAKSNLTLDYGLRLYHIPTQHQLFPEETLDAVFIQSKWNAAKAPRYYTIDPTSTSAVIDPANPGTRITGAAATFLRYTIVPGSGDILNGVSLLGAPGVGNTGVPNPRFLLFAPRGGFAWSPRGNTKTVIRGGFGWSYNRINIAQAINIFENSLSPQVDYRLTNLATLSSPTNLAPITPRTFGVQDTSRHVPTVYDFSLSLQRELPFSVILDLAYIGNLQRHQSVRFNLNAIQLGTAFNPRFVAPGNAGSNFFGPVTAANPGALPGTNTVDNRLMRPFQGFDALDMNANVGNLAYNSFQVSANKRFSHGLSFQAAYTLSRLESGTEGISAAAPYSLVFENWKDYTGGVAGGDRTHVFTLNYTYDIPAIAKMLHFDNPVGRAIFGGWRFAHLLTAVSGDKFSVGRNIQQANTTTNVDMNKIFLGTPDVGPRLQLNGDPSSGAKDLAHQFDATKFAIPGFYPNYTGLGERNYLTRPGNFANDMTLTKAFAIHEKHAFELRASFYNAFNQVRRTELNTDVLYKANGRTAADGFTLFNRPEDLAARNPNLSGVALYNQYRTGVGHYNLTNVNVMRVIEIGLKYRF